MAESILTLHVRCQHLSMVSDELYVYGGFRAKNRKFIDSVKTGQEMTSSPFHDCVKTMEIAETILARALLKGE